MATRTELNAGVDTVVSAVASLVTEQAAAFARLEALIASGLDFTPEIEKLTALNASIQAAIETARSKGVS